MHEHVIPLQKNDNASVMFGMSILQIEFCAWLKLSLMVCNHQSIHLYYCIFVHMHIKVHITVTRLIHSSPFRTNHVFELSVCFIQTGIPRPPFFIFYILGLQHLERGVQNQDKRHTGCISEQLYETTWNSIRQTFNLKPN